MRWLIRVVFATHFELKKFVSAMSEGVPNLVMFGVRSSCFRRKMSEKDLEGTGVVEASRVAEEDANGTTVNSSFSKIEQDAQVRAGWDEQEERQMLETDDCLAAAEG